MSAARLLQSRRGSALYFLPEPQGPRARYGRTLGHFRTNGAGPRPQGEISGTPAPAPRGEGTGSRRRRWRRGTLLSAAPTWMGETASRAASAARGRGAAGARAPRARPRLAAHRILDTVVTVSNLIRSSIAENSSNASRLYSCFGFFLRVACADRCLGACSPSPRDAHASGYRGCASIFPSRMIAP